MNGEIRKQRQEATALSVAAQALQRLDTRLDTALILATKAQRLATKAQRISGDLPDTLGSLLTAAYHNPRLIAFLPGKPLPPSDPIPISPVGAVAFSPDAKSPHAKLLATGDYKGRIVLWRLPNLGNSGEILSQVERLGECSDGLRRLATAVSAVAFSPHAELLATALSAVAFSPEPLFTDAIRSIAFSPNGVYMAACSKDGSVKIWPWAKASPLLADPTTVLPRANQEESEHEPTNTWSATFSPDSTLLAFSLSTEDEAKKKGQVKVWDITNKSWLKPGLPEEDLPSEPDNVRAVAFHPGPVPTVLAAGFKNGTIVLWRREDKRWDRSYKCEGAKRVTSLAFSPRGDYLAAGREDCTVSLYKLDEFGAKIIDPKPFAQARHEGAVSGLSFSKDGSRVITSGNDGTVRLWNVPDLKPVGEPMTGHVGRVTAVAFSPDGRIAASGGIDSQTILWDTKRHEATRTREPKEVEANFSIAFSHDGVFEANGYNNGRITRRKINPRAQDSEDVEEVFAGSWTFSEDDFDDLPLLARKLKQRSRAVDTWLSEHLSSETKAALAGYEGQNSGPAPLQAALLHDFNSLCNGPSIYEPQRFADVDPRPETESLLSQAPRGEDLARLNRLLLEDAYGQELKWNRAPIMSVSRDDQFIAATSANRKTVRLKKLTPLAGAPKSDISTFVPDVPYPKFTITAVAVAVTRDGKRVAAATKSTDQNALVFVWDVASRKLISRDKKPFISPKDEEILSMEFSPDGKRLATGGDAEFAIIWNLEAGTSQPFVAEHNGKIRSIAFSPDGQTLATAAGDNRVILWNASDGSRRAWPLRGHLAPVVAVTFSHDGKVLASGSDDRSVILWDVRMKQGVVKRMKQGVVKRIGQLTGHTDTVRALAFSPDDKRLFSGSWEGETRSWELDPKVLKVICFNRANPKMQAEKEWKDYLPEWLSRKTWKNDLPKWLHLPQNMD